MFVRSELAWVVSVPVPCGNCGKESLEMVARLVNSGEISCAACGCLLDLNTAEWTDFRHALEKFYIGKQSPIAPIKKQT